LAILLLIFGCERANAHGWYTGKKNPVTGVGCCNKTDCREVGYDDVVAEEKDGVRGYRWLNAPNPLKGWIPEVQVLTSHDGKPHVCWYAGEFRCLFLPFST